MKGNLRHLDFKLNCNAVLCVRKFKVSNFSFARKSLTQLNLTQLKIK